MKNKLNRCRTDTLSPTNRRSAFTVKITLRWSTIISPLCYRLSNADNINISFEIDIQVQFRILYSNTIIFHQQNGKGNIVNIILTRSSQWKELYRTMISCELLHGSTVCFVIQKKLVGSSYDSELELAIQNTTTWLACHGQGWKIIFFTNWL